MRKIPILLTVLACALFSWSFGQNSSCTADFSASATGSVVTFTDASVSSQSINSYWWDFGDGDLSNQQNPIHAYSSPGAYLVSLSIQSGSCNDVMYDTLYVTGSCTTSCQAAFGYSESGSTVSFTDSSTASGNVVSWMWDFGDGSFSFQNNPQHSFAVGGWYEVCLTIETSDSCSSTICDSVYAQCNSPCGPASFTYNVVGDTVYFTNTSQGTYASSGWVFGDGGTSSDNSPVYVYSQPGSFNVCLCIYDAAGNICDIVCQTVQIQGGCNYQAGIAYTVTGNNINFQSTSTTNGTAEYSWYVSGGNGAYYSGPGGSHTFPGPGNYTLCLTVQDSLNWSCYDSTCVQVQVLPDSCNYQAGISYTQNGASFNFQSNSTVNSTAEYYWYVSGGNGNSYSGQSFNHTFPGPGNYYVCLTVQDSMNWSCYDSTCIVVEVLPDSCNYQAGISYTQNGANFNFQSNSTVNSTAEYYWYVSGGNGNSYSGQSFNHTFPGPGNYYVCLTVQDSMNWSCYDSTCIVVEVLPDSCNYQAGISYTQNGANFNFQSNSTVNATAEYYWYVGGGNGSSYTSQSFNHTFPGPGNYYVCLTVQDSMNWNCYDSTCIVVEVLPDSCNYQAGISYTQNGANFNFQSNSTVNSTAEYYWYVSGGNGNSYSGQSFNHTFPGPGNYYVCLTVQDSMNWSCYDSTCIVVEVLPDSCNYQAGISYTQNGANFNFQSNSTVNSTAEYYWYVSGGNGSSYTSQSFNHTFPGPGNYYVCLTVQDSMNWSCYDSTCIVVEVLPDSCNYQAGISYTQNGANFNFQSNSTVNSTAEYYWYVSGGNGNSYSGQSFNHTFPGPGNYYVCLTVQDSMNWSCYDSTCIVIEVLSDSCNYQAGISYTQNGANFNFQSNSTVNSTAEYYWYVSGGNGNSYSGQSFNHTFPGPGNYYVCLTVQDSMNWSCYDSTCIVVEVLPDSCNYQADISYTQNGANFNFQSNSTVNSTAEYYWYVSGGNGSSYTSQSFNHTFPGPGNYYVCLTVQDSLNWSCYDSTCIVVEILPDSCNYQAGISYTQNGANFIFQSNSTVNSTAEYYWYVSGGNGSSYTSQSFNHTFPGPGNYYVCLTVQDSLNWSCYDSTCIVVEVLPDSCNYQAGISYTRNGFDFTFQSNSTANSTANYDWYIFGNNNYYSQSGQNISQTLPGGANYDVCLFIWDSLNSSCYDSTCINIRVGARGWTLYNQISLADIQFRTAPNPTRGETTVSYDLPVDAPVHIEAYNLQGLKMADVVNEPKQLAGPHAVDWSAAELPEGMYLYRIVIGDAVFNKRFVKQ